MYFRDVDIRRRQRERHVGELAAVVGEPSVARSIGDEYGRAGYRAAGHHRTLRHCDSSLYLQASLSPDTEAGLCRMSRLLLCLGYSRNLSSLRSSKALALVPSQVGFCLGMYMQPW